MRRGVLLLPALWTMAACASTGAVPKPFPVPGGSAQPPAATAPADPSRASGISPPPDSSGVASGDGYAIAGTALSLRGTPYRDGGSSPVQGFDCSGFVQFVFSQYGVALPRAVRDQFATGVPVPPDSLLPGDLLFFSTTAAGASHVAIAIGGDQFVHAPSASGSVRVEHLNSTYWAPRFVGARRLN